MSEPSAESLLDKVARDSAPLRVCLVGGIYGKEHTFGASLATTPETTLECGLRALGHCVSTHSHYDKIDAAAYDIIHVHHLSWGAPRMALMRGNTPFVFTSHDPRAMSGTLPWARRTALRYVLSAADAFIALSRAESDFFRKSYGVESSTVIANGIDADTFSFCPKLPGVPSRTWTLLYAGQLNAIKRVDLLIAALPELPGNVTLQLVYHTSALEAKLREQVAALGLDSRVRFLGGKSRRELATLYQQADIFVLPSSGEALPSVVSEAMLCGTPVVATDVGGIAEQLGGFGVVVPAGSSEQLVKGIARVLSNYDDFTARAQAMRKYAIRHFSVQSMIDNHLALYRRLRVAQGVRRRRIPELIRRFGSLGLEVLCKAK
jgi:glycosyltransferase involved in cell wall biosynthesis